MSTPVEITMHTASVGAFSRHLPHQDQGMLVPSTRPLKIGTAVTILLSFGDSPGQIQLSGTVIGRARPQTVSDDATHAARVSLDRASWKSLFVAVCRAPRLSLHTPAQDDRSARFDLDAPAWCFLPQLGRRLQVTLTDVSQTGAFITLPDVGIARGDVVRFRAHRAMSWQSAQVRWQGSKVDRPGAGIALAFDGTLHQQAWTSYVTRATHQRAS